MSDLVACQSCLTGGGEAGARLRAVDWFTNPLGPVEAWPLTLQAAVRIVLSSTFPMMLHWGPDLTTIYNDAYAPSLGSKHPGQLGRPAREWWSEMWDQLTPIFDQVLAGGTFHVENACYTPDRNGESQEAFFTHCHSPLWDEKGRIAGIFLVVTETTRQVVAERELVQANAKLEQEVQDRTTEMRLYRNIVQSDTSPILAFDRNYRVIGFNEAHRRDFLRVMGQEQQIGDNLPALFPAEQATVLTMLMDRALVGETFSVVEEFGDLERPNWEIAYSPLCDDDGAIVGAFHHARDISARLRAERELGAVTDRLAEENAARERTWQFTPDLLSIIDLGTGRFERLNPAWTAALGWSIAEMEGRTYAEFVHPDDIADSNTAFEVVQRGEPVLRFENRYRTKDGHWRRMSWVAFPEGDKLYSSIRDVTDAHEQAAALAAAEDALRQSQKMEAVGQLTGGLAHDFNNLLAGMMGNLELLQMRIARGRLDDLDRFINAAQGAGRRAASLTQRLLAFSRRQTLDPKPTDVNRLLAGLQELLHRTVGATVEIEVVQTVGLWTSQIDGSQLENAIINLCVNGRDAMPHGGKLTIETANRWIDDHTSRVRDLPPGQYVSVCVTDTGTGMSAETVQRAFEPFFTTKPIGQGTGLGLSMIYGFARQSGGQVRIHSELGQGTTVCIYLPRFHGDTEVDAIEMAGAQGTSASGQTILVVDDEATIRHILDEVLDDLGYTVIGAADGAAGIKVLQSGARIELLITDVGLPNGMNGRQVADEARRLRPGLKVLFITGFAENAAVGNGHLEPGMELLTKPFTLEALVSKVAEMVRKPGGV